MKKIPMRRCVATGESLPKKELLRIVKNKDGEIFVDTTGAYIKKDPEALALAIKKNALGRALEAVIEENVYDEIRKVIDAR